MSTFYILNIFNNYHLVCLFTVGQKRGKMCLREREREVGGWERGSEEE